jgi:hypothetical protein
VTDIVFAAVKVPFKVIFPCPEPLDAFTVIELAVISPLGFINCVIAGCPLDILIVIEPVPTFKSPLPVIYFELDPTLLADE